MSWSKDSIITVNSEKRIAGTVSWTRIRDTQPFVFTCTKREFHGLSFAPHIRMSFTRVALRESAIRAVEWENSRR